MGTTDCYKLMVFRANMKLDPRTIVWVCAAKSARAWDKNRLLDIYHVWVGYLEK